jgi:pyruvate/2-oxoglutarate dehydrogenase complex dihydrolipoamide acyltransferase (E2) component
MSLVPAPRINTNDDQVGVVAWHVEDGGFVDIGDDLADLETSKAVVTITAELAGYVQLIARKGDIVKVGMPICRVSATLQDEVKEPAMALAVNDAAPPPSPSGPYGHTRFSPQARKLLALLDIPELAFAGAGLITGRMVKERKDGKKPPEPAPRAAPVPALAPAQPGAREEVTPLAKRAEIEALTTGENGLINSTISVYFDSAPVRARLVQGGLFEGNLQPLILYEISRLLRQWPQFTAYFDDNRLVYYDRVDLGIAIDLGRGLKVATIREADQLMIATLHERTLDFAHRYMANQLQPEELVGATFTVSDLSSLDVLHFKPLINGRQSAILGLGGDSTRRGHPMSLNLTFDHRVSNGREGALFLKELRDRLLSYAPADSEAGQDAAPLQQAIGGPVHCERCGIDYESYVRSNRDALMFACVGENGALVPYCRSCASGFI